MSILFMLIEILIGVVVLAIIDVAFKQKVRWVLNSIIICLVYAFWNMGR